jgi:SAM-dependent methyltransferase
VEGKISSEVNVGQLKRRIREEIERRQEGRGAGAYSIEEVDSNASLEDLVRLLRDQRTPVSPLKLVSITRPQFPGFESQAQEREHSQFRELCALDDLEFVRAAYLSILKRNVDDDGLGTYRKLLREGAPKLQIIEALLRSPEGKSRKAKLSGVRIPLLLDTISRWPLIGGLFRMIIALWNLPDTERQNRRFLGEMSYRQTESEQKITQLTAALSDAAETIERSQNAVVNQVPLLASRAQADLVERAVLMTIDAVQNLKTAVGGKADSTELRRIRTEFENAFGKAIDEVNTSMRLSSDRKAERADLDALTKETNQRFLGVAREKADQTAINAQLTNMRREIDRSFEYTTKSLRASFVSVDSSVQKLTQILSLQDIRISDLLAETRERFPGPNGDHELDTLYASFEDEFRGTREDIRNRQSIYLPHVQEVNAGTEASPVIDVGSGRGEWLELLRDHGLVARGVDTNRILLSRCRDMNLDVTESDALTYLRRLAPNSVGAVTAFHIIEHMPHRAVIAFLDEAFRVLKPGGLLIAETPNPRNLVVGACTFYLDPTHLNPIPLELSSYLLGARGFCQVEVLELHPYPSESQIQDGTRAVVETLNRSLFSARDYAVIGRKSQ